MMRWTIIACLWLMAGSAAAESFTSMREVRQCLPEADGRIWAATQGGLRLIADGDEEQRWTRRSGLGSTDSHSLLQVGAELWVGGARGITRLDVTKTQPTVLGHIAIPEVRQLLRTGDVVYAASWGAGVWRLSADGDPHAQRVPGLSGPAARVTSLAWIERSLYAGTGGAGLFRFDGSAGWTREEGVPARATVFALGERSGDLAAGTLGGLWQRRGRVWTRGETWDVRAIAGPVLATFGDGLVQDSRRGANTDGPRELRFVNTYAETGRHACAGGPQGLWVSRDGRWRKIEDRSTIANDVAALARDRVRDRLWIGGFDDGLSVRTASGIVPVTAPVLGRRINAIALAESGDAWIATPRGLLLLSYEGQPRVVRRITRRDGLPSDDVHTVVVLEGGRVLAGTSAGAAWIEPDGVRPLTKPKGGNRLLRRGVWTAAQSPDGTLWLGTSAGLLRVDQDGGLSRLSRASGHLRDDWVTALVARNDELWVGTYAGGVAQLQVSAPDASSALQLGGGQINLGGLTLEGDVLYAATMTGLSRYEEGRWHALNHAAETDDVTGVVADADGLWLASRSGVTLLARTPFE